MRTFQHSLWLLLVFAAALEALEASGKPPQIVAPPQWADAASAAPSDWPPIDPKAGSVEYLLVRDTLDLASGTSHRQRILRPTNAEGLSEAATLEIPFNPHHESLVFHTLRAFRGGQVRDLLPGADWHLLRREEDLRDQILSGSLSRFCLIPDVRVGDIIEYQSSITGLHPTFDGRWFSRMSIGWDDPVTRQTLRVIAPPGRVPKFKAHSLDLIPEPLMQQRDDGSREWVWEFRNRPTIESEQSVPIWVPLYPWIQITEMEAWSELADWGLKRYPVEEPSPALRSVAAQFSAASRSLEEVVAWMIRFVQDEIRYTGVHEGPYAFQPTDPLVVLSRRYGDCKDKSRLLAELLRAAGVNAFPALVSSHLRHAVNDALPSPVVFDHLIVRIDDAKFGQAWVDPTISMQGGDFRSLAVTNYGKAFVIRKAENSLTDLEPPAAAKARYHVTLRFDNRRLGGSALLTRRVQSFGEAADDSRKANANVGNNEFAEGALAKVRDDYEKAEPVSPYSFTDDRMANTIVSQRTYEIPNFWTPVEGENQIQATLFATDISEELSALPETPRKTPISLGAPRDVRLTLTAFMPTLFPLKTGEVDISGPGLEYKSQLTKKGNLFTADYDLRITRQTLAPTEVVEYNKCVREIQGDLGLYFTHEKPRESPLSGFIESLKAVVDETQRRANEAPPR